MSRILRDSILGSALLLLAGVPAVCQVGRFPSPFPGGRPGVGLPPPVPGGGRQPRDHRDNAGEPLADFTGTVRQAGNKELTVEGAEAQTMVFSCTRKTKYYDGSKKIKSSAIKPGDRVTVEARRARDGTVEAVNVRLEADQRAGR